MRLEDLADDMCGWCGGEIDRDKPHASKRKFCCIECQIADYRAVEKQARIDEKESLGRSCRHCGEPIAPTKFSTAVYCSDKCRVDGNQGKASRRHPLICRICRQPFYGHHRGQLYCSNSCKGRMSGIARRAKAFKRKAAE